MGYFPSLIMTIVEIMSRLQTKLKMTDALFSAYLKTDVTTIRKVRSGDAELPIHSKFLLLDRTGFIKITNVLLNLLPKKAQEKVQAAIQQQAHNLAQQQLLAELAEALKDESID